MSQSIIELMADPATNIWFTQTPTGYPSCDVSSSPTCGFNEVMQYCVTQGVPFRITGSNKLANGTQKTFMQTSQPLIIPASYRLTGEMVDLDVVSMNAGAFALWVDSAEEQNIVWKGRLLVNSNVSTSHGIYIKPWNPNPNDGEKHRVYCNCTWPQVHMYDAVGTTQSPVTFDTSVPWSSGQPAPGITNNWESFPYEIIGERDNPVPGRMPLGIRVLCGANNCYGWNNLKVNSIDDVGRSGDGCAIIMGVAGSDNCESIVYNTVEVTALGMYAGTGFRTGGNHQRFIVNIHNDFNPGNLQTGFLLDTGSHDNWVEGNVKGAATVYVDSGTNNHGRINNVSF